MSKPLSFHPMNAGINNQKLALLGLVAEAKDRNVPVIWPGIVDFMPGPKRGSVRPFNSVFDEQCIDDALKLEGVTTLAEEGETTESVDLIDPWQCFTRANMIIRAYGKKRQFKAPDLATKFFCALRVCQNLQEIIDIARIKLDERSIQLACQMRIEYDWLTYCEKTLSKRVIAPEDYKLSYDGILQKISKSSDLGNIRAIYITVDETQLPVTLAEISAASLRLFGYELYTKGDLISGDDGDLDQISRSLIDFELALSLPKFVGLSRSTFSNMIAFTRLCRAKEHNVGKLTDFVYNTASARVIPRIDHGTHVAPFDVCGPIQSFSAKEAIPKAETSATVDQPSEGTEMTLWSEFLTNRERGIHKWKHYFPIYERHFAKFINTSVTIMEIGCGGGGSLQMWKRYLGPHANVIGVDIREECKKIEEDQISVCIGSQSDVSFLDEIVSKFGVPDIILDDGSHIQKDLIASFEFLYPKMPKNGVYVAEDLHTSYWPGVYQGGLGKPGTFIEYCKKRIDDLNAEHTKGELGPSEFTRTTHSICFYDSVVVVERGLYINKGAMLRP